MHYLGTMITQSLHNICLIFAQSRHYPNPSRSYGQCQNIWKTPPPHPVLHNIWTAPNRSRCHGLCQSRNMDLYQITVLKWNISILVLNPNPNHSGCHGQWSSHCEMSNAGKLIRPGDIPRTQPFTQTSTSIFLDIRYSWIFLDILRYSWSGLATFQGHNTPTSSISSLSNEDVVMRMHLVMGLGKFP